jgi:hypothetical protein
VKGAGFYNLSYVPKVFRQSDCLYVGSVKTKVHSRFKQHVGIGSGRTGALYLNRVLLELNKQSEIVFNAYVFDKSIAHFTEHLECVFHDKLMPLIGKRAFNANVKII